MMRGTGFKYDYVQLCNAADHKTTMHLQFVQVGAHSQDASGKCPSILIAKLIWL